MGNGPVKLNGLATCHNLRCVRGVDNRVLCLFDALVRILRVDMRWHVAWRGVPEALAISFTGSVTAWMM
jgi:hypothetical protein